MPPSAQRIDVAAEAGVSESTVSRALNDSPLISAPVKARIREIALRLGYVPNRQAALFARRRTQRLGFAVRSYHSFPPFSRAYFPSLLDGVVTEAEDKGYSVTIVLDSETDPAAEKLIHCVQSRQVDGLLLAVSMTDDPRVDCLLKARIPFVLINNYRKGLYSVDGKPENGMRKAFEHAHELGHRRIGYIAGDMRYRNAVDRQAAFQRFAEEFDAVTVIIPGDFSRRSGYIGAGSLLRRTNPPSLIMTACDRQALGVLDYARQHDIHVPNDLSVIGYDNLDPARDITPSLTTIDNPIAGTGRAAASLLIDIIEGKAGRPVARRLDTGFVIRESTGTCPVKEEKQ